LDRSRFDGDQPRPRHSRCVHKDATGEAKTGQMHEPLSGAVLAHDRLFRPAGTLLESDSVEMAERSISTGLEKFVASRVKSHLTNLILGFVFFARVP
jgi:hypothetical protein